MIHPKEPNPMTEPTDSALLEPFDAHVRQATKLFRDVGFTLHAMQFPRPAEALEGLRRFNNVPDSWQHPFAWGYFPNAGMRDNWRGYYGAAALRARAGKGEGK